MNKSKRNINNNHNSGFILDKALMLNRIKFHYDFTSNAQLALFLGIKPNTLSNWIKRNTMDYDLVFTKCEELNPNWIINGMGSPTKHYANPNENPIFEDSRESYEHTNANPQEIDRLNEVISAQEQTIAAQAKTIDIMERLINGKS